VITYILIAVTVAASFYAWKNTNLFGTLMMNPYRIYREKQYYRFVTSGFIHKDHMHLLLNMLSLYFFGPAIEQIFKNEFGAIGGIYFVIFYILAIIVSDLRTFQKHKNNPGYNSLGASGAVSAVIFAFIIFRPLDKIYIWGVLGTRGFIMGALFIALSYYQGKKAKDNINHDAHLYGALFGLIFCVIVFPHSIPEFIGQIRAWIASF
jgi:membrane associated rhomboid family serine protease